MSHRILIVTTSTGRIGADAPETGFDWASVAVPYWRLREAGAALGFASPRGGKPPGDPATAGEEDDRLYAVDRFLGDETAVTALAESAPLSTVEAEAWDAALLADGLGGLWDLSGADGPAELVTTLWAHGGVVGAIGAGTAALIDASGAEGRSFAAGRRLATLPDAQLQATAERLDIVPPVAPETRLRAQGAEILLDPDAEGEHLAAVQDGRLITGQDARAAADVALQMIEALDAYAGARRRAAAADADAETPD
jgi:putative intracellular protease/amidase